MSSILRKLKFWKDKDSGDKTTFMIKNGATVLKELIASSHSKYNSYRIFSAKELKLITNNYYQINIKCEDDFYEVYDGFWRERLISVMKYKKYHDLCEYKDYINSIIYAAQMSHNHILKLIGCCLETQFPILVFEYFHHGTLADRIHGAPQPQFEHLLLTHRLKIAMDIANAVAYIHIGFPRPIIIRDFRTSHIVFNEENVAKLFDFSLSISIPEGETQVTDAVRGTYGYAAPEYVATGVLNEKADVYSFGIFLFELLTGQRIWDGARTADRVHNSLIDVKKFFEENRLDEIVVERLIVEDRLCPQKEQQLQAFRQLILECVNKSPEDRPTMVDVAKKLRQMYRSCM